MGGAGGGVTKYKKRSKLPCNILIGILVILIFMISI